MGLAGFCLALALASEYTAGIVVLCLLTYVGIRDRHATRIGGSWVLALRSGIPGAASTEAQGSAGTSPHRTRSRYSRLGSRPSLWRLAGTVTPLLLIPAYGWATIGAPFDLPYSYQASFPEMKEGPYAVKWPDLENLGRLLVGPTRGLVFWTPFLIMAGLGWLRMAKERPQWLWLTYAVPILHALVISGRTWDWQAGPTISARYMAPIIPLLALACAMGTERWPKLGGVLAIVSIAMVTLATLTDACPGYHIYNPLTELHIPKLITGDGSYTLGTAVLGLPFQGSVIVYYAILVGGVWWLWKHLPSDRLELVLVTNNVG